MKLSIFGLGDVGCVSAACFAARGHTVIGLDANPQKTEFLAAGKAPVVEERIGELTAEQVASGRLTVSSDPTQAVRDSDLTIVCVGTPSAPNGSLSTEYLERATEQIGAALAGKDGWHVVVRRSTIVPETCERLLVPIFERVSGMRADVDFGVCVNPEFLRDGTSVRNPRPAQDGGRRERSAQRRAGHVVVRLPKDLRALTHNALRNYVEIPVLASLLASNETHLRRAADTVIGHGKRKVAIFGLSLKAGTDLRESPMVELAERLIGKGCQIRINDANVALSRLMGANRAYIEERLPHIGELLGEDLADVVEHGEVFVVRSKDPEVAAVVDGLDPDLLVPNLVRLPDAENLQQRPGYRRIGW